MLVTGYSGILSCSSGVNHRFFYFTVDCPVNIENSRKNLVDTYLASPSVHEVRANKHASFNKTIQILKPKRKKSLVKLNTFDLADRDLTNNLEPC